jgi:hypothetical protein
MNPGALRVCNRCKSETDQMFCPSCRVLTYPPKQVIGPATSSQGEAFECTIWQGPNRNRGIEVPAQDRDKFFSKEHDMVILHIEASRTVAKLGSGFWRKPAVIKKALGEDGRDKLGKFIEKHHLLPPEQSLSEKGIVDTIVFEVVTPAEEFKITIVERMQTEADAEN